MEEYVARFIVGGMMVSAFAALGDVFRPKSFAGLFGAAPSIAIATLAISLVKKGPEYIVTEARSMILGAVALGLYSLISCQLMKRFHFFGLAATALAGLVWFASAAGLYWLILRGA